MVGSTWSQILLQITREIEAWVELASWRGMKGSFQHQHQHQLSQYQQRVCQSDCLETKLITNHSMRKIINTDHVRHTKVYKMWSLKRKFTDICHFSCTNHRKKLVRHCCRCQLTPAPNSISRSPANCNCNISALEKYEKILKGLFFF